MPDLPDRPQLRPAVVALSAAAVGAISIGANRAYTTATAAPPTTIFAPYVDPTPAGEERISMRLYDTERRDTAGHVTKMAQYRTVDSTGVLRTRYADLGAASACTVRQVWHASGWCSAPLHDHDHGQIVSIGFNPDDFVHEDGGRSIYDDLPPPTTAR